MLAAKPGEPTCKRCGDVTRFEGVRYAQSISDALNERARDAPVRDAAATGTIQTPRQIMTGQNLHRCAACSPGGSAITVVPLPTAAAALPPER
jgi:hypothetical protein